MSLRRELLAALLIVLVVVAAAGAFLAVQHLVTLPSGVWSGCGGDFQCTTVRVPLDYSDPSAGSIGIAVIRKPATDRAHRLGALVLTPGGTGVDYLRRNSVFYGALNTYYDLVAFDQRGFGRSAPIRCLTDPQIDSLHDVDTVLDDSREKQVFFQAEQALAQACEARAARLLSSADTGSAAWDVDAIRVSLGAPKLSFLAFGYGAFLAEVYATLFPVRVAAMALDGAIDTALHPQELWPLRAAGFEASLQAFLADCRALVGCLLARFGDPGAALTRFMRSVDLSPARVGSRALGRSLAVAALMEGLDPHSWRQLDAALTDAVDGHADGMLALADLFYGRQGSGAYGSSQDAATAVDCLDNGPFARDVGFYDQLGPAMAKASPIFGPAFQYMPLVCTYWHASSKGSARQGAGDAPAMLLIRATHDPFYPYSQAMNGTSRGSVLLTRDGYGYLSYANSVCVRLAVADYLTRHVLPAPRTVCTSDYPA